MLASCTAEGQWVISGCAGQSAARQVNLKNSRSGLPELDRADLKLRNRLAG
jgi:hypothetical protein